MSEQQPMSVLDRASRLVEVLAERGPMTATEIADETGTPRPSVYRLAEALHQVGLATTLEDSRIQAGRRWMRLADAARAAMSEWDHARDVIDELSNDTAQTVFLSVPRGDDVVCIDWAQGRGVSVLLLKPGRRLPLYAGAAGRVALAHHDDVDRYLRGAPFPALTPRTLTTTRQLRADIDRTLAQGYVHSDGDVTHGIGALGMPVIDARKRLRGLVSLGGLAQDVRADHDELLGQLEAAAARLSSGLS